MSDGTVEASDYWTKEEQELDIPTKEALALDKVLLSFADSLKNAWVDGLVDNQSVVYSWQRQGRGRSMSLNRAIKKLFFTTSKLNIALYLTYVTSKKMKGTHPLAVSQLLIANSIRSYSKEYNKSLVVQRDTRVT